MMTKEQFDNDKFDYLPGWEECRRFMEQNMSVWRKKSLDDYELYCECFFQDETKLSDTDECAHSNRIRLLGLIREAQRIFAPEDCGYLSYFKYLLNRQEKFGLYDLNECRKDILLLKTYGGKYDDVVTMDVLDQVDVDFSLMDNNFAKHFLELPYNKRKVLMPVNQYTCIPKEHVQILDMQQMSDYQFPLGHPIANELYIGHPLIPQKYIPVETYQLELVEDKVREFCEIAQSLGALEIKIECQNNNSFDSNSNGNRKISVEGNYKVIKGNGNYHDEYSHHLIDELSRSINLHQTFCPKEKPHLPENLVWYENEPSWQRLVKQRLTGTLSSHEERIETKKCQMVESHEMREIKGELSSIYASMNLNWDKTEEMRYQMQANAVLCINVQFAPLSQLENN